jgi:2-polyprenyl-3-methyl-5-hydroxy-6-metoxy-1,4-benzoquinol methylase
MTIDENTLQEFMGTVLGDLGGATTVLMVCLGDELGLYEAMDGAGPMTAAMLGERTGCQERLVQDWLDQQAAAGYVEYDDAASAYTLPAEQAMALARRQSPVFVASGMTVTASMFEDLGKVAAAFRGDGALAWGEHSEQLFRGTAEFFRPGYQHHLVTEWIPALDGTSELLAGGARVADVGCGYGISSVVMARAYERVEVHGFDSHPASIDAAREVAGIAGVSDRVHFRVADAADFQGEFDLVCFFDALHDMGDPVGIAAHARQQLAPGGAVVLVEPFAHGEKTLNHTAPTAKIMYGASAALCTPNSLSQPVGRALGAQAGEPGMAAVFAEAGYSHFRRISETPFNIVYEARA